MKNIRTVTKSIRTRVTIAVAICTVFFLILIGKLFSMQLIQYDFYKNEANSRQLSSLTIDAPRGTIYDSDMNVLAQSATVWNVIVNPKAVGDDNREKLAAALSEILDISYEHALNCTTASSEYMIARRKVEEDICEKLREWTVENSVNGIRFEESSKRYYPYGNYLASILGFTGTDNYGLYGLEYMLDNTLAGVAGRTISAKNGSGGRIYYEYEAHHDPEPGKNVVLTIDETVQYYLEKYVEETMQLYKVENYAVGIVLNVKTGEILGMTTKPDYDPNAPFTILDSDTAAAIALIEDDDERSAALSAAQQNQWTNKAISSLYYPGSVFKPITAAAALESGAVSVNDQFVCRGTTNVAGVTIGCNNHTSHGVQSFAQTIIHSCNVSFINMGLSLGPDNFYNYFKAFGLTEKTGIDLPMEGTSIYYTNESLGPVELATSAFGQSNALTPIQVITAFSAVVNGGYLLEPYIVSKVVDEDGNIISENTTTVRRQVISEETSAQLAEILRQTATNYVSQNAYVKGYRVGGKTGTSEKQGGPDDEYIASFCGFAPAEDPEVAVLVLFDNPRGSSYYGGVVAAPCVGKIFASILPHLGVDPVYNEAELKTVDAAVPSVRSQSVSNARNMLTSAGFSVKIVGDGESVDSQFPQAGMSAPKGSTIVLYTGDAEQQQVPVPNLTGLSLDNAKARLLALGLNVKNDGSNSSTAVVSTQSVASGQTVPAGTVITVYMTEYGLTD